MHIALDGRHQDLAGARARIARLLLLHIGQQIGNSLFHHARRFDDLRQEHLAGAEEIANDIHTGHQRAFDHVERPRRLLPRLFDIGIDIFGDAGDERMFQPLLDRLFAPGEVVFLCFDTFALVALGERQQPFRRIGRGDSARHPRKPRATPASISS